MASVRCPPVLEESGSVTAFNEVIDYVSQRPTRFRPKKEKLGDYVGQEESTLKPLSKTKPEVSQGSTNDPSLAVRDGKLATSPTHADPSETDLQKKRSLGETWLGETTVAASDTVVPIDHRTCKRRKRSRLETDSPWDRMEKELATTRVQTVENEMAPGLPLQEPPLSPQPDTTGACNDSGTKKDVSGDTEDIQAMAALLGNELQPFYDPKAGNDAIRGGIRDRRDHVGRPIKTGPYTKEEHALVKAALMNYFANNGWDETEGWQNISAFGEGTGRTAKQKDVSDARHWETIAMVLPQRSVRSVQLYAHRRLYPWTMGPWSVEEEKDLVELVSRHGSSWTKFAYEYFHRPPNHIHSKWKDLEPRVSQQHSLRRSHRHVWTKEEDVQLLTAIKMVTGVTLPYRAIPWAEVQRHMPSFSSTALAWRYKNTLFPLILAGKYRGAHEKVLLRQFLRYVHRSLEAGVIKDLSEVEGHRVVPFWYSSNHVRRMSRYLKSRCPVEIQEAPLDKQIEFMYKLEKCEKKERHDLRRLARTFRALQEINGVKLVPAVSGVLSQRFKDPLTQHDNNLGDKSSHTAVSQGLFKTVDSRDGQLPPATIPRPLTAVEDKVKQVVPPHLLQVPEAFPVYLEAKRRRERKGTGRVDDLEAREQRAEAAVEASGKGEGVVQSHLDYHLFESLGLLQGNDFKNFGQSPTTRTKQQGSDDNQTGGDHSAGTPVDDPAYQQACLDALQRIEQLANESDSDSSSASSNCGAHNVAHRLKKHKTLTWSSSKSNSGRSQVVHIGGRRVLKKQHPWLAASPQHVD